MNNTMMKLLMINQHAPDLNTNAFLAFRGDMVGMLGARNLAQAHAAEVTRAEEAQTAHEACRKARFEFIDKVARVVCQVELGTEVTDMQRKLTVDLVENLASQRLEHRTALQVDENEAG